jgi:outer membrane protein assembly factor BamB
MNKALILTLLAMALLALPGRLRADPPKDPLAEAMTAYNQGQDTGNQAVRDTIERDPGNMQLALAGLRLILQRSGGDPQWTRYASTRLLALQKLGVLSWHDDSTFEIYRARFDQDLNENRRLSAKHQLNVFSRRYPAAKQLREMSDALDKGHPTYQFVAPTTGSPLALLSPTDLGDLWTPVPGADPAQIVEAIDTIIQVAVVEPDTKDWVEDVGNLEAWTVMDLYLRRQPVARLAGLRAYQEKKLRADPDNLKLDALQLFRRFPWAETAHRRLLDYGSVDLGKGRLHAAYRSFDDVRTHSVNPDLRSRATVGCLLALAGLEDAESLAAEFEQLDAKTQLPWMGKSVSVEQLRSQIQPAQKPARKAPDIETLKIQTVVPPPIQHWKQPKTHKWTPSFSRQVFPELQVQDDRVVLSSRHFLAAYDRDKTDRPKWLRKDEIPYREFTDCMPGSYAPALIDGKVYARNRSSADTSQVMNVIDLASGSDLWSMGRYRGQLGGDSLDTTLALDAGQKFLSKPVLADGLLIYLSNKSGPRNSDRAVGKYDAVVAVDRKDRRVVWRSPIRVRRLEKPKPYLCGIPPLVHKGFVYTVSSQKAVSCHDLRDGRPVWVHKYSSEPALLNIQMPRYAGSPVIVGNRLFCSPLDKTVSTIALDLETGRLLWKNPYTYAVEQIGRHADTVLVRDELTLAALSADDGKIRWSRRCEEPIIARVQLAGDRIYVPTESKMVALSASNGTHLGQRSWDLPDGPPQTARVDGDRLFVVGNTPYLDPAKCVLNPNAPKTPALKFPLNLAWELSVSYHAQLMMPPPGSPLAGKMYYQDAGILTCVEANPQGGIVWQRFMRKVDNGKPIFFGELLVLRSKGQFIAFDGRTGERRWSRKVSGRFVQHASDYILDWSGSNGSGKAVCLDPKTGKIRWQKTYGHGTQAFAQANVIHFFQTPSGKPLRHFVVNPLTGETIQAYEDILQDVMKGGGLWTVRSCGAKGALLGSDGKGKQEYRIYKLDGKKPNPWRLGDVMIVNVIASNDKFTVVEESGHQLVVYKFEDDGYRATPLAMAGTKFDRNNMFFELDGDRLFCVYRGRRLILFDLQAKTILHDSEAKESQRLKNEKDKEKHKSVPVSLLRDGNRLFIQMRPPHNAPEQAPSYFLDLQTGRTTEAPGSVLWTNIPWYAARRILRYSNGLILLHQGQPHSTVHALQCWSPSSTRAATENGK